MRLLLAAAALLCVSAAPQGTGVSIQGPSFRLEGTPRQGELLRGVAPEGAVRVTFANNGIRIGPDRSFIIGIDRDHPAAAELAAEFPSGETLRLPLAVEPRQWRLEHIDTPLVPPRASATFAERRPAELARIGSARSRDTASEGWRQRFIWPSVGRVSGVFGSQRIYRGEPGSYHSGVDVASGAGAQVVAPADGVVVLASPPDFTVEGNLVIVDHGAGLNSAFLHLATVAVREGQAVRQGDAIGTVGATGRATGPHLHWALKWRDARLDPATVAGPMAGPGSSQDR